MAHRGRFRFDSATVEEVRRRWLNGQTKRGIAADMGMSISTVQKFTSGLNRTLLPSSLDGEEWRVVDGYGGRYYVSNYGRLYSNGAHGGRAGLIRDEDSGRGYRCAIFSWDGITHHVSVHRLVAEAFCDGKSDERQDVNHIDGNKANNRADNLEWVTRSENMLHSVHVLGNKTKLGIPSPNRKLTKDQVREIRTDTRPRSVVAEEYGVGRTTIDNVRLGRYYKDVI